MFCKKCGKDIGDARFCPNCGFDQQSADGASMTTSSENQTDNQPVNWKRVNKIAYGVIAILLGDLGIHKFYSGKILYGVLYLLFCWTCIPGILGLIEGIIALTKPSDANGCIAIDPKTFLV